MGDDWSGFITPDCENAFAAVTIPMTAAALRHRWADPWRPKLPQSRVKSRGEWDGVPQSTLDPCLLLRKALCKSSVRWRRIEELNPPLAEQIQSHCSEKLRSAAVPDPFNYADFLNLGRGAKYLALTPISEHSPYIGLPNQTGKHRRIIWKYSSVTFCKL